MPPQKNIGRAELAILHYIADHHPVSVRQVAEHFAATRGHVRTTVLNVMERLRKKGFLRRKKVEGFYQYYPRDSKATFLQKLVRDFVESSLGGSLAPFVAYLIEEGGMNEQEWLQLKDLVAAWEAEERKTNP